LKYESRMAQSTLTDLQGPLSRALRQVALAGPGVVLFPVWAAVVGPLLAGRSRPVRLHQGALTIEIDSDFLAELENQRHLLCHRLDERLGKGAVRQLHFLAKRS
jgi:hypothetical protein